jgi:ABC-type transport system involved in multi-copper enzyme maturation permease subunit
MIDFSLVRKDFGIVLRGNLVVLCAQLLFILIMISFNMGVIGYGVMATAFGWQMLMSVSAKEKESHSIGLLISMPFGKRKIINSRYASTIIAFLVMSVIYEVFALLASFVTTSLLKPLNLEIFLTTMVAYIVFISITLPLYFRFDDTMVRGISLFLIMAFTIGFFFFDMLLGTRLLDVFRGIERYRFGLCLVVIIGSLIASRNITLKMFENMEF